MKRDERTSQKTNDIIDKLELIATLQATVSFIKHQPTRI